MSILQNLTGKIKLLRKSLPRRSQRNSPNSSNSSSSSPSVKSTESSGGSCSSTSDSSSDSNSNSSDLYFDSSSSSNNSDYVTFKPEKPETRVLEGLKPSITATEITQCNVTIMYGENEGETCNKDTTGGKRYCDIHLPTYTEQKPFFSQFIQWFRFDPLIEFSVLSEEIKQSLYRSFINKAKVLAYILDNPTEAEYIAKDHLIHSSEVYARQDFNKWRKQDINKYNLLQMPSDILLQWNSYKKYRGLTKEYRLQYGIPDQITYLAWQRKRLLSASARTAL